VAAAVRKTVPTSAIMTSARFDEHVEATEEDACWKYGRGGLRVRLVRASR
jgi:hypothetical protein